jgi:hypothetical protein
MDEITKMQQRLTCQKNRKCTFDVTIKDKDGNVVNISSYRLVFTVDDKDGVEKFTRKNTAAGGGDDEIEITDGPNGICRIKVVQANTSTLTASPEFLWDLMGGVAANNEQSFCGGQFLLVGTVGT